MKADQTIALVNEHMAVRARTVPPNDSGYLLLAAEVAWHGPLRPDPPAKRRLLDRLVSRSKALAERPDVVEATTFRARLVAPGEGRALVATRGVHRARYDVVSLVRTASVPDALRVRDSADYRELVELVEREATHTLQVAARNAVRLGDVDHSADDVFLFNYFYADDRSKLLPVFEYTAGWFQRNTRLPNSTLLQPLDGERSDHGIINHASWPHWRTFLPSLLFRRSFRTFVLANFAANGVAAQPILYRRL